jgi:hypothetical protein
MFKIARIRIARHTLYSTLAFALVAGAPAAVMLTQPAMAQSNGGGGGGGGGGGSSGGGGGGGESADNPALSFILEQRSPNRRGRRNYAATPNEFGGQGCEDSSFRQPRERCYYGPAFAD